MLTYPESNLLYRLESQEDRRGTCTNHWRTEISQRQGLLRKLWGDNIHIGSTKTSCALPTKERHGQGHRTQQKTSYRYRRRVAKGASQFAFDFVLRCEVQLLEHLWRQGDASCGAQTLEGVGILAIWKLLVVVLLGRDVDVLGVFLGRHVGRCGVIMGKESGRWICQLRIEGKRELVSIGGSLIGGYTGMAAILASVKGYVMLYRLERGIYVSLWKEVCLSSVRRYTMSPV